MNTVVKESMHKFRRMGMSRRQGMSILQLSLIKLFQLTYIVMELFFSLLQFYSDFTAFCVSRFWICARLKKNLHVQAVLNLKSRTPVGFQGETCIEYA